MKNFLTNYWLSLLAVFVPVALVLDFGFHAGAQWVFLTSAIAIIPLAGWMGRATEHLAERVGAGLGALLNATFGNAAELIIAVVALNAGLYDLVKASITGSIIGNILLVFGLAALLGGLQHPTQRFNRTAATNGAAMLVLSAIALVVPALFHLVAGDEAGLDEQSLSVEIAAVLMITYVLSLVFTLKTHSHLYLGGAAKDGEEGMEVSESQSASPGEGAQVPTATHAEGGGSARAKVSERAPMSREAQAQEDPAPRGASGVHPRGHAPWSAGRSLTVLLASAALVGVMSELLVGAAEEAAHVMGMNEVFVGVILVALIGNAAEHSSAVLMAMKNKMDLAVNIAVGSSIQVALFVAPLLVFLSYVFGPVPMDLRFTTMEVVAVGLSVGTMALISMDGESHWMEGVQLLAVYVILGIAFFFLPV